jgi:hypothetical protein
MYNILMITRFCVLNTNLSADHDKEGSRNIWDMLKVAHDQVQVTKAQRRKENEDQRSRCSAFYFNIMM